MTCDVRTLGARGRGARGRASAVVMLVPLLGGLLSANAEAADFRIRLTRLQGKHVTIYHDDPKVAADGEVAIQIGATTCVPVAGDVLKPLRGGDAMTTLIVIDRGGTATTGMGQHTDAIRNAVGGFLESIVGKGAGDRVAIVDTPGRDREPGRLPPTDKPVDVKGFLGNLPAPSGSGADVYGTANIALAEFDKAGSPLGAMILISDGIDPAIERDASAADNHEAFIREARRRGVPVAAIYVGRSADGNDKTRIRIRNGRAQMVDVANRTNGEFHWVDASGALETDLRHKLDELGAAFAKVMRTSCDLCGKIGAKTGATIAMQVRSEGTVVARSLPEPPRTLDIPADDYGSCDRPANSARTDGTTAGGSAATCGHDTDCPTDSKCEQRACVKRKTMRDLLPWAAGGLLLLSGLFLLLGWQRKQTRQRKAAEQQAEEARLDADRARLDAESARRRADDERTRAQAAVRSSAAAPAPAPVVPAAPTVGIRLVAAAGSVEHLDRTFGPGTYVLGSAPDSDCVLATSTVSGNHAQLSIDATGRAEILDLGSSNGSFLNQVAIAARQPVELRPGDTVGLSRQVQLQVFALAGGPPSNIGRGRTRIEE